MPSLAVADSSGTWRTTGFVGTSSAPTIVSTTVGDGTASITWAAPTNPGAGVTITGYLVGRDGTDSTGYGAWETTVAPTTLSQVFSKLVNGTTYNLYVETVTNFGAGQRVTVGVTPSGAPPPGTTNARQLGLFMLGFPKNNPNALSSVQTQLLGGGTVLLAESFYNSSWSYLSSIGGSAERQAWQTWLALGGTRRAVIAVGLVPNFGPDGTWASKKGTDAEVSAALAAGAAGSFDAHWTTFANNLTSGLSNAIIRLAWEFNGGWYSFRAGANPTAFVTYWQRVYDIIKTIRPNVLIDWNASGGTFNNNLRNGAGATVAPLSAAMPSLSTIDIIGVDMYDYHYSRTKALGWSQVTGPALEWWANLAATSNKPMSIPEWGHWPPPINTVDADNDLYVNNMWTFIEAAANNVLYHVPWWGVVTSEANGDHSLLTGTQYPNARAAVIAKTWRLSP